MSKSFKVGNKMDIKSSHKMMNNHLQNSYQNPSNNKTYTIKSSNKTNKHKKTGIDIKKAYKIKPSKIWVDCGVRISVTGNDIEDLKNNLGADKVQIYKNENEFDQCLICEEKCIEGEFAVQRILCIPKKDPQYENLRRFMTEIPRVCCFECANDFENENPKNKRRMTPTKIRPINDVWNEYIIKGNPKSPPQNNALSKPKPQPQMNLNKAMNALSMNNNNNQNNNNNSNDMDRDPFDDGFLICTQLVKTGGADQGGLQVGDVFVEFGHYSKKRFPGLKSIANLVRRSAGKEIPVVVWRKLEQMGNMDDDAGRTVFQKLALKLKPLQSHDADGGGVLGAVINTYPLPEMKN